MKKLITTVVTADDYQWYIPLFCYSVKRIDPTIDIKIFVRGKLDAENIKIINSIPNIKGTEFIEEYAHLYPKNKSTTNALRFVIPSDYLDKYDYTIITDVDFILFPTTPSLFDWHIDLAKKWGWCFAGHHGPWKRGCPFTDGWTGEHERISGGFFMITPEWIRRTEKARLNHSILLQQGIEGLYREEDEVMLCKIQKESNLSIPQSKIFPLEMRGIHLGDFKFDHRWTNMNKMSKKLMDTTCRRFRMMQNDKHWKSLVSGIKNETINEYLTKVEVYLAARKI